MRRPSSGRRLLSWAKWKQQFSCGTSPAHRHGCQPPIGLRGGAWAAEYLCAPPEPRLAVHRPIPPPPWRREPALIVAPPSCPLAFRALSPICSLQHLENCCCGVTAVQQPIKLSIEGSISVGLQRFPSLRSTRHAQLNRLFSLDSPLPIKNLRC